MAKALTVNAPLTYINGLLNLCYPSCCCGCQEPLLLGETTLCTNCLLELPRTDFHLTGSNPVADSFMGRSAIDKGAAFLHFEKEGIVQNMLHQLKYKNRPEVGVYLGKLAAHELKDFFKGVDLLVPVPLHPKKLKKRGYNQALKIAEGLSVASGIALDGENLIRVQFTDSQTLKGRFERWLNVKTVFQLQDPSAFSGKKIMLVDDVLTTGSTMEGCLSVLEGISGAKLSVFTLAFAR